MAKKVNAITTSHVLLFVVALSGVAGFFGGAVFVRYSGQIEPQPKIIERETIKEYIAETSHEQKIIDVVENVSDGVVSIVATKDVPVFEEFFRSPFENDLFFRRFFPELQIPEQKQKGTKKQQVSAGTGFVVSDDGLIITNKHVVSDEDAEYTVIANNGDKYQVEVLARDPVQDLAILRVVDIPFPALRIGDSESLQKGQTVIAIGNALGELDNTVSVGVVSGLRRTIVAFSGFGRSETLEEVIQTDTAINPGNSGGPLLNLSGEVIGVNVAMAIGAENIGFAIPINLAKKAIADVKEKGKIIYPFLGVRYIIVSEELKENNNLSVEYGALITRGETINDLAVIPGSAADKAGLVENDIILEVNGEKITQDNVLAKVIQKYSVGDTVGLKILHKGDEKEVQVVLGER